MTESAQWGRFSENPLMILPSVRLLISEANQILSYDPLQGFYYGSVVQGAAFYKEVWSCLKTTLTSKLLQIRKIYQFLV